MKFQRVSSALVLFAVLAGFGVDAAAQAIATGCQHRRAENVPAQYTSSGIVDICYGYFVFLGLRITQSTTPCPIADTVHPAHQECSGSPSYGTNCVLQGDVPVLGRTCSCESTGTPTIGSSAEHCRCSAYTEMGTFEDWQTVPCAVIPPLEV